MTTSKNKFLIGLIVILILANIASIAMFWIGKPPKKNMQQKGSPAAFLIKELNLNAQQQLQLETLRKEHVQSIDPLRNEVKNAKEAFFDLLQTEKTPDSIKETAVKKISELTEKIDLITFNHFEKVRAICDIEQQKKFDEIIKDVVKMMGPQGPPLRRGDRRPPKEGDFENSLPHPPQHREGDAPLQK